MHHSLYIAHLQKQAGNLKSTSIQTSKVVAGILSVGDRETCRKQQSQQHVIWIMW